MQPIGFHLVFRARDSRILVPDTASQRTLATITHRIGERYGLCAFRASGDHLHATALCDREAAGRFAQALGAALTQALPVPAGFGPTFLKPMIDQRHVDEAFHYVLRNTEKHGVGNDPLHEASSLPALLGLREAPSSFVARIRAHLPRVRRGPLIRLLGIDALEPCVRVELLADAAAGAVGLPALDGSDLAARARAAAARLALPTVPLDAVARALSLSDRSVRRLRAAPDVDDALERIVALRMGHRAALGDRARLDLAPLASA